MNWNRPNAAELWSIIISPDKTSATDLTLTCPSSLSSHEAPEL